MSMDSDRPVRLFDREPPHSVEAERAVLGAMLINPRAADTVLRVLGDGTDGIFYCPGHEAVYNAVVAVHRRGVPADLVTVCNELGRSGQLEFAGGVTVVADMTDASPTSANVEHYAEIIRKCGVQRHREALVSRLALCADDPDGYQAARAELDAFEASSLPHDDGMRQLTLPHSLFSDTLPPMEFAFTDTIPLDAVSVLAATGGTGKSFLSLELAASIAIGRSLVAGLEPAAGPSPVVVLNLEDDRIEIMRRLQRIARAFRLTPDEQALLIQNFRYHTPTYMSSFTVLPSGALAASTALLRWKAELAALGPRLVIVDPLAAMLGGTLKENDNEVGQAVIGLLRGLLPDRCAMLVLCHTSKADQLNSTSPRGAASWRDSGRQHIGLRPPDAEEAKLVGDNARNVAVLDFTGKANYGAHCPNIYLTRSPDPDTGGVLRAFDIVEERKRHDATVHAGLREAVLRCLTRHNVTTEEVWGNGKTDAKERGMAFRAEVDVEFGQHIKHKVLCACLKDLVAAQQVTKVKQGARAVLVVQAEYEGGEVFDTTPNEPLNSGLDTTGQQPLTTPNEPLNSGINNPEFGVPPTGVSGTRSGFPIPARDSGVTHPEILNEVSGVDNITPFKRPVSLATPATMDGPLFGEKYEEDEEDTYF